MSVILDSEQVRERRRFPRALRLMPAEVVGQSGLAEQGISLDVSAGGISLGTARAFAPGAPVRVRLGGGGDAGLVVTGRVIRCGRSATPPVASFAYLVAVELEPARVDLPSLLGIGPAPAAPTGESAGAAAERRGAARKSSWRPVILCPPGAEPEAGITRDVSETGMLVWTFRPVPVGLPLIVRLPRGRPGPPAMLGATIVRAAPLGGELPPWSVRLGLRFDRRQDDLGVLVERPK